MAQLTVQQFTIKKDEAGNPKKDNYGNTQMMIKFAESPETVYKAVKDPATVTEGKVFNGTIVEGQYGFKFKADPFNQPPTAVGSQPLTTPQGVPTQNQLDVILEIVEATYEAVTGEKYSGVKKETTPTVEPVVEPTEVSDEELNEELGF